MPYGDRTGPWGRGSMTGRGAGYCTGYDRPGYMNRGPGFGMGRGMGRGRGRGFGRGGGRGFGYPYPDQNPYYGPEPYYDPNYGPVPYTKPDPEAEKKYLEKVVDSLEKELKAVKDRLQELVKGKSEK